MKNLNLILLASLIWTCLLSAQNYGDQPVMDMRIRLDSEDAHCVLNGEGTFAIWFDIRTTDGSRWLIDQMQNSIVFPPELYSVVTSIDTSDWVFNPTYTRVWSYSPANGVLAFLVNTPLIATRPDTLGGPDSLSWTPVVKFTVNYTPSAGATADIAYWYDTPHYNARGLEYPSGLALTTCHYRELGAPLQVSLEGTDSDGDGVGNIVDGDDDNDGIPDTVEGDNDPDNDGLANRVDIDSDGDGITDLREAQPSFSVVYPSGVDLDGDGVDAAFDVNDNDSNNTASIIVPVNTDGVDNPDYLDINSENDGVEDFIEGHDANQDGYADRTPIGVDTDCDGLDDVFDTVVSPNPVSNPGGSNAPLQNTDTVDELDWRDENDDNDELLTIDEDFNQNNNWADDDPDGDGHPAYLDKDDVPVELSSFTAELVSDGVLLEWETQSETENLGFYLYRSTDKKETPERITKKIIPGAGNSNSAQKYKFIDNNVQIGHVYYYTLADVRFDGYETRHKEIQSPVIKPPSEYALEQNYPNPFNPETVIPFRIKESGHCDLTVFNIKGQKVKTLVNKQVEAGFHKVIWDGKDSQGQQMPTGVYLYRLDINGHVDTKKMHFIK
ncbi:T9SS type A sorting domain-containing protein [candidate division KSB1 bacterium]|nr:T9SS type A sorting domain-containing protein [candidate division KSB1 bacterium]